MYCKMSYDITISNEIYHEFPNKLFPRNHSTSYVMERTYSYKYKLKTGGVRVVKQWWGCEDTNWLIALILMSKVQTCW